MKRPRSWRERRSKIVYVETDFLIAPAKDSDPLKENAEEMLRYEDVEVSTSILSYAKFLLLADRYNIERVRTVSNLLDIVSSGTRRTLAGGSEGG